MGKGRCLVASVAWLDARRLPPQRAILLVGMLLAAAHAGTASGFTLIPASESWAWQDKKVNIVSSGIHNVFVERYQGRSQDLLRIVGVSLDLNGPTTWSLASYGDRHRYDAWSGKTVIPQYMPGGPYGAGVPVPGETFYVAVTESETMIFPPWEDIYGHGWIHFQLAPPAMNPSGPDRRGDLILLDSFFSYDKRGVVVGQHRVVPEPGALVLAGTAVIGAVRLRRYHGVGRGYGSEIGG